MADNFWIQKPRDNLLASLVDSYFYLDIPVEALSERQEYVLPFPRITFGYFFDHPFMVTNHDLHESKKVNMVISRISAQKITVIPLTDRIRILGAHVRPYTLASLTNVPIHSLPWLIDTVDLFGQTATQFRQHILNCRTVDEMFVQVEQVFLNTILDKDLNTIIKAVDLIESKGGSIRLSELSEMLTLSERAVRDQFQKHIGCSPKEFIQLVQLKQSVHQMNATKDRLTQVSYKNNYFDQAHFINSFKKITGKSPKSLRKEMLNFRFLQF